jgi:hypothetical protein
VRRKATEREHEIRRLLGRDPLVRFSNSRGDKVLIFLSHTGPS